MFSHPGKKNTNMASGRSSDSSAYLTDAFPVRLSRPSDICVGKTHDRGRAQKYRSGTVRDSHPCSLLIHAAGGRNQMRRKVTDSFPIYQKIPTWPFDFRHGHYGTG